MGASIWHYFVPYTEHLDAALQLLQESVFREGRYYKLNPDAQPRSINELREMNEESGTHSILDVWAIEEEAADKAPAEDGMAAGEMPDDQSLDWYAASISNMGKVFRLSRADCVVLFGTAEPSRVDAESKIIEIANRCDRWTGKFVVIYDSGTPAELLFVGVSGD
jgi:hypothetical protein